MPATRPLLQLKSARVTNYGCFCDSGEVPIDEITALVAENEYGKTTFLRALAWWDDSSSDFDEEDRWDGARLDIVLDIVALTFTIPKGISALITRAGFPTPPDEIRIIRDSEGGYRIENAFSNETLDPPETKARMDFIDFLEPYRDHADVKVIIDIVRDGSESTATDEPFPGYIQARLSALLPPDQMAKAAAHVRAIDAAIEASGPDAPSLFDAIGQYLPKLIYFDDAIEFIDDSVTYAEAEADPAKHRTMINLAKLANIDLLHIRGLRGHQRQAVGNSGQVKLSSDISKYWHESEITFYIQPDAQEMILTIEHRGRTQRPSRRSSGLKWFIGFFVNFMANADDDLNGAILLLDEPGLRLHVAQQPKLLELFQRLASDGNRIVYSTHLSQMLMPEKPTSYRLFVKDEEHPGAAVVVPDITKLSTKSDVLQPVRQALGMGIANAIGLGGYNLIVEGWTERLVLLTASSFCSQLKMTSLKTPSISILPAGGSGAKMLPLASMALAESTFVVVLVDNDRAGESTQKVIDKTYPGLVPVVRTHTEENQKNFEIEDLFERTYYLGLVNDSHKVVEGFEPVALDNLDNSLPVCDALKKRFKELGLGDFQKTRPAFEFQGRLERNEEPLPTDIEQFALLFGRINDAFQL